MGSLSGHVTHTHQHLLHWTRSDTKRYILHEMKTIKGGRKVKILKQGPRSKMDPSGPISLKFCMQGSLVC